LRALILFQAELAVQHGNTAQRTFALVVDVELVHATRASVLVSALRTVGDGVTAELALAGADEVVVLAGRTGRTGGAVEAVLQEAGTFQAFGVVEEVGALLAWETSMRVRTGQTSLQLLRCIAQSTTSRGVGEEAVAVAGQTETRVPAGQTVLQYFFALLAMKGRSVEEVGVWETARAFVFFLAVLAAGVEGGAVLASTLLDVALVVEALGAVIGHWTLFTVFEDGIAGWALPLSRVVIVRLTLVTFLSSLAQLAAFYHYIALLTVILDINAVGSLALCAIILRYACDALF
jgi:hypothetical protein